MIFKKDNFNLFLNWDNHILLENIIREKKNNTPNWIVNSIFPDTKEYNEKMELYYIEIKRIAYENPVEFTKNWLNINLEGEKASENIWKLLDAFCKNRENFYLKDNRSLSQKLESDYIGDFYSYFPIGKEFSIVHSNPTLKNWYGKTIKKSSIVEILIKSDSIKKIIGKSETNFIVYTMEQKISFSENICIEVID